MEEHLSKLNKEPPQQTAISKQQSLKQILALNRPLGAGELEDWYAGARSGLQRHGELTVFMVLFVSSIGKDLAFFPEMFTKAVNPSLQSYI